VIGFTDFPTPEACLNGYAITGSHLAHLSVLSRLITSSAVPIIPAQSLQRRANPEALQLAVTRHGGHCGFLERLSGPSWVERKIVEEFEREAPASRESSAVQHSAATVR